MRKIPLNHGKVALVDDEDYELVASIPWVYTWQYAVSKGLSMHRVILGLEKYDPRVTHHINGNGLDNRRANLEIFATSGESTSPTTTSLGTDSPCRLRRSLMDTCKDCGGTGQAAHVKGSPCPYCRPDAARKWAAAQPPDYDPREDADSELVGNPREES